VQEIVLQYIAHCYHHKIRCFVLIPKLRQGGVSTFVQAWNYALFVLHDSRGETFTATTIAHVESSATKIFRITRRFEKNLPARWRRPLESRQKGMIETQETGCTIWVSSSAEGDSLEKGGTLSSFHGSEVANWADRGLDPSDAYVSVMGALVPGEDAMVFLESTAKGRDAFFYKMIMDSLAGRVGFQTIFLPWFLAKEYKLSWRQYRARKIAMGQECRAVFEINAEEEELCRRLASVTVKPGEQWHKYRTVLTEEQLVWRRATIEDECKGELERFQRYYPATLEECFAASVRSMFSATTIDHYYNMSRAPLIRGDLAFSDHPTLIERKNGYLKVWEVPIPGEEYVIGADVSEGLSSGDAADATVVHKTTLRAVARFHGQLDPDRFAEYLVALGYYYNTALLAPENNFNPSVGIQIMRRGYPRLHFYRPVERKGQPNRPGWNTNKASRKFMLDTLGALCRDRDFECYDEGFAEEMSNFVWIERKKHFAASSGKKDDRIMSSAIAVALCGHRKADGTRAPVALEDPDVTAYKAMMKELNGLARDRKQASLAEQWVI